MPDETELNAPPILPIIDDAGGDRESAPEGTCEQGRLLDPQEPSHTRLGETTRRVVSDAPRSKYDIAVALEAEEGPSCESSAENSVEEKRTPEVMEGCPEPRTATGRRRARQERGNRGIARMVDWGLQSRLHRRTTPKRARIKEKDNEAETWKLGA